MTSVLIKVLDDTKGKVQMSIRTMIRKYENTYKIAATILMVALTYGRCYAGNTLVDPNDTWIIDPPLYVDKYYLPNDADLDSCIYQAAYAWNFHCSFELQQGPLSHITVMWGNTDGALAKTRLIGYVDDGANVIERAEIWLDQTRYDSGYNLSHDGPTSDGGYYLVRIMMHEFGHCALLNHSNTSGTAMIQGESATFRNTLASEDISRVKAKWGGSSDPSDCDDANKIALVNGYMPDAGLVNLRYVGNVGFKNRLLGESYTRIFHKRIGEILGAFQSNQDIMRRLNRVSEDLARDLHLSLASGNGYEFLLSSSRIRAIDELLEVLSQEVTFDTELERFRDLLRASEGRSFWSLFEEDAFVRVTDVPTEPYLNQNAPNPFNPSTVIRFGLPKDGYVLLRIYSTEGQLIRTLLSDNVTSGSRELVWDGKDDAGESAASGVYIAILSVPSLSFERSIKMVLIH